MSTPAHQRVLIVEDEDPLRSIIRSRLEREGVEVTEARDAAEAVASMDRETPDLMLLDINLPDRTGWDVLRSIQATRAIPPTVVVSAVRIPPARLREFGVVAYLPKPFPMDALVRIVVEGIRTS
jgi:DNA-binding response OmpR family regulator